MHSRLDCCRELQKARAVKVVTQEAKAMQEPSQATTGQEEDMHE